MKDDLWDRWFMAYPATALLCGLLYSVSFLIGLIPVFEMWITPQTFDAIFLVAAKYTFCGGTILGSLWALYDYHQQ